MPEGSSSNFVLLAIPRFDGHYIHWAMLMNNFCSLQRILGSCWEWNIGGGWRSI